MSRFGVGLGAAGGGVAWVFGAQVAAGATADGVVGRDPIQREQAVIAGTTEQGVAARPTEQVRVAEHGPGIDTDERSEQRRLNEMTLGRAVSRDDRSVVHAGNGSTTSRAVSSRSWPTAVSRLTPAES